MTTRSKAAPETDELISELRDRITRYEEALEVAALHRDQWRQREGDRAKQEGLLSEELNLARVEMASLRDELEEANASRGDVERLMAQGADREAALAEEIVSSRAALESLKGQLEDANASRAEVERLMAQGADREAALAEKLASAEAQIISLSDRLVQADLIRDGLEAAATTREQQVAEMAGAIQLMQNSQQDLQAELENLRDDLGAIQKRRQELSLLCLNGSSDERAFAAALLKVYFHEIPVMQAISGHSAKSWVPSDPLPSGASAANEPGEGNEGSEISFEALPSEVSDQAVGDAEPQPAVSEISTADEPASPSILDWNDLPDALLLFDESFYLTSNSDVAAGQTGAFEHYRIAGWHEGRAPHPLFDTNFYLRQLSEHEQRQDVVRHYLIRGHRGGIRPSPHFDDKWYRERYGISEDVPPLIHYLQIGRYQGFEPNSRFDSKAYRSRHPGVDFAKVSPIEHFVLHQKLGPAALGPFWEIESFQASEAVLRRLAEIVNAAR